MNKLYEVAQEIKREELPVLAYKEEILKSVKENTVTIIKADTGAGKSTQIPQMLLQDHWKVTMTEPRRIVTRTIAERIAEEMDVTIGSTVGYCTAFEKEMSEDTEILLCTDGLQLVKCLKNDFKFDGESVLVIDEVHEWNLNIEGIIAWCKETIEENPKMKLVIISATLETEKLASYFGCNVNIITIPGRRFPVKRFQKNPADVISTIANYANAGKSCLVFVPGKKDIENVIEELESLDLNAVILPLHGDLSSIEQKECFKEYSVPKIIVATNIGQSGITPDVFAVVDTGKENRIETIDNVEALVMGDISKADCIQRMGRVGRCEEGEYVLCSYTSIEERPEYPIPEIQRCLLDQVVLRFADVGMDALELSFFHQPKREDIILAKQSLQNLGALIGNQVTELGHKMAKLPISCKYARMILEADKYGVVQDVITIAAILEAGNSLINHKDGGNYYMYTNEMNSDLLAELDIWNVISNGYVDFKKQKIFAKTYFKVREMIEKITHTVSNFVTISTNHDKEGILRSCMAGLVDNLYHRTNEYFANYENERGDTFTLDNKSCMISKPEWVIGIPRSIPIKNRFGFDSQLNIICMPSRVTLESMMELAPQLFTVEENLAPYYSSYRECCMSYTKISYKGVLIERKEVESPNHPMAEELKKEWEEQYTRYYMGSSASVSKLQEKLDCNGKSYEVHYDWGGKNPRIYMDKETLFSLDEKNLKLENGTNVAIVCEMVKADNVPGLKNRLDQIRMTEDRNNLLESLPKESSAKLSVVSTWLLRVGKVEVTRTENGAGQSVYSYIALKENGKKLKLELIENEEEANKMTQEALLFLFGREIKEKYGEKKFMTSYNGKKVLTKKGKEAKELFDDFVRDAVSSLTVDNFIATLKDVEEIFSEVQKEYLVA